MTRARGSKVGIALLVLIGASGAAAHPVDLRRTSLGADEPFSLRQAGPPAPGLYDDAPVTDDVATVAYRFSEPGLNHTLPAPLGLVLYHGSSASRPRWVIYDMLAWTPVRHLLYQDPGPWLASAGSSDGPAARATPRLTHFQPPAPADSPAKPVPTPTTATLLLAALALCLPRRPKRTTAHTCINT